jgi:hypothetical protein
VSFAKVEFKGVGEGGTLIVGEERVVRFESIHMVEDIVIKINIAYDKSVREAVENMEKERDTAVERVKALVLEANDLQREMDRKVGEWVRINAIREKLLKGANRGAEINAICNRELAGKINRLEEHVRNAVDDGKHAQFDGSVG